MPSTPSYQSYGVFGVNTPPPQPVPPPTATPALGMPAFSSVPSAVGGFVPTPTNRPPDSAGDLSIISPMRVFADLAVSAETGLLRFEVPPHVKEVYLVRGAPESVNSSLASERFGEYLVARGFMRPQDLDAALANLPRFSGKLGDTLVGLGIMRPLDVFRLLSQQVRERVMEIFAWVQGYFSFYRGVRNPHEAFPLGLDTFEILGAGVLTLPYEFLERKFLPFLDYRPRSKPYTRIAPEAFRLGPTPRDLLGFLDGSRTLREWMGRFTQPAELLTFLRTLYLLVETDLAQFE
jgi:serine/threonine-protein kinase